MHSNALVASARQLVRRSSSACLCLLVRTPSHVLSRVRRGRSDVAVPSDALP